MSKYSIVFLLLAMMVSYSCTVYRKTTVSGVENLRSQADIRIYAIYMVNGDTVTIDHNAQIITRITDNEIEFIDREGSVQSVPVDKISGLLIKEENPKVAGAIKVTKYVVIIMGVAAAVALYYFFTAW